MATPAKEIFGSASELPPAQRGAFLDSACRGNAALRARVEALLRALDESGSFLSDPTGPEPPRQGAGHPDGHAPGLLAHIAEGAGAVVGRYKLLQPIGEGGFGVVFMAEQREPVVRRVALKIIKLGMDTRQVIARFEAERQALAMMDHPCIARVLDAGATDTGRPYFVMELVRGEPITHHCDKSNLTPMERLELFIQVCHAVQHAHTKGIIHRDIKPSNVLVTMVDGHPVPKVIDFGIAKATSGVGGRLTDKTIFTEFRQLIGTPEYMSPEQAEMSGVDIDTRTDIYSLGVLLYELLVGVTPFDGRKLRSAAWGELQRIIREEEPAKPSTRLSTMKDGLASVAAHRRTEPARLPRLVRGDLDWIVMKCLEKSRARRYDTASGLAADVRRHLDGEPVLAAPPGAAYRVRKFMRRHRVGVGVTVALGAAMALGIIGTGIGLWQAASANTRLDGALQRTKAQRDTATSVLGGIARRFADDPALASTGQVQPEITFGELGVGMNETRAVEALGQAATQLVEGLVQARRKAAAEAEVARKEASKARSVTDFLQQLLEGVSPEKARTNREVTVREIVDRSAKALNQGHPRLEPEVEATVRGALGQIYRALGEYKEAQRHLERAIALGETGALSRRDVSSLRNELGNTFRDLNDPVSANAAYQQALSEAIAADGPRSATAAGAYNSLAGMAMLNKRLAEAAELFAKALDIMVEVRGENDPEVFQIISNQAVLADRRAQPDEAERLLAPLLQRAKKTLGDDDPFIAETQLNLGVAIAKQGRFDQALPLVKGAEELSRRIYGDAHPRTVNALMQLGGLALFGGDPAEAERCYGAVLHVLRAQGGDETRGSLFEALRGYSSALEYQDKTQAAEPSRRELLAICRDAGPGRTTADLATHLANLGHNLGVQGRWSEVEPLLRECVTIRRAILKEGNPQFWSLRSAESMLGAAIAEKAAATAATDPAGAAAAFAEAESLIIPAAESVPGDPNVPKPLPHSPDRKRQTLERAVKLYELWGRLGEDVTRAEKRAAWQERLDTFGR